MGNTTAPAAALLLVWSGLAAAQGVPGRPVSPEARLLLDAPSIVAPAALDSDLAYPPAKPVIHLRSEWLESEWGCRHMSAQEVGDEEITTDLVARVRIAVHHTETFVTAGEQGMGPARSAQQVKTLLCGIRNYHMSNANSDGEAWADIGYHYLIDWKGRVWQGRKVEKQGANVSNMNPGTIGVALLGDFERQHPTPAQLLALKRMLAYLVYAYKISPLSIHGHHEYKATSCPGRYMERKEEYNEPYVEAKASPLRRIRMRLIPLWDRMRLDNLVAADYGVPGLTLAPADASSVHLGLPPSLLVPSFDQRR